ncbi:GNAT family N-acetyltransferase [Saccharospirillum mangrovi]|uniref:GNAT family N-acetyltransferase n=1 Tax=Saccharospirillum mangrovi TaxID=2161747 RepID=UPI0013004682|nr:GNAT family N-acetyltransferase [Saccharospirillum mangrovi]
MTDTTSLNANEFSRRLFERMQHPNLIRNLHTQFLYYQQDGIAVPTTLNDAVPDNCWVVSPLTQILGYAQDELPKLNSTVLRGLMRASIAVLGTPLRRAQLDKLQIFNNQCLSTNVYADAWQQINLKALRLQALQNHPDHALMLRSLNAQQNSMLMHKADQDGWLPIVNRQVYLYQNRDHWWSHHNARMDDKLLQQSGWSIRLLDADNHDDLLRAEQLYNQLYLDKYSRHNVQFTAEYFAQFSRAGLLSLYGLFNDDELLGVAGFIGVDQTITAPIIGYDTQQPQRRALYRRLMAFVIRYALDRNLTLNLSAGSPDFKRRRGGDAAIEYSYVYVRHLNVYRRATWRLLSWLSRVLYRPLLERFKL